MKNLTNRQKQILDFIQQTFRTTCLPPTRAEIAKAFGFKSTNASEEHLRALAAKGAIELASGKARGIRLTAPMGLAIVGSVAAGSPILAEQQIEGHLNLDEQLFQPKADYLLRVHGMSMKDAGILDGDLLAVHKCSSAKNGQVVVARLQDEVTVKRFQQKDHVVELLPENDEFQPIRIDLRYTSLDIEGIGVGLIRNNNSL